MTCPKWQSGLWKGIILALLPIVAVSFAADSKRPVSYPLKLQVAMDLEKAAAQLQSEGAREMSRKAPEKGTWSIQGLAFGAFHPNQVTLSFWKGKLHTVNLYQTHLQSCDQVLQVYESAVAFVEQTYAVAGATVTTVPSSGSPQCGSKDSSYAVSIWKTNPYTIELDAHWTHNNSVMVSFSHVPTMTDWIQNFAKHPKKSATP